ncbi:MAG: cytochrome c oxidase assembly protein [Pirellulaceae bacterium]|nr:cytochrome c oxidase assembly protein [Pirellulaceae bacterium]
MRNVWLLLAAGTLLLTWGGPIPAWAGQSFVAHMSLHMLVVALAAPLLAMGIAGSQLDPVSKVPVLFQPIPASLVEMIVVWIWHAPTMHHWAQGSSSGFAVEQTTFLLSGLWLWLSALGGTKSSGADKHSGIVASGDDRDRALAGLNQRRGAGVLALLLTSMHMTLLGALLLFSPRVLFAHHAEVHAHAADRQPDHSSATESILFDQQLGGAIMLVFGGAVYLLGGLWLTWRIVPSSPDSHPQSIEHVQSMDSTLSIHRGN